MKKSIFVVFFIFISVQLKSDSGPRVIDYNDRYLVYGFERSQPPPLGQVVEIANHEIGLTAQQTCGYTDWSTVQIKLPKELLSKEYWRNVQKSLVSSAKSAVMSLAGAIPGMLVCNVSPTYCHIYNQAEMMAAFEGQLTFDTCKMLDGVANVSGLQSELLRKCITSQTNEGKNASVAREICLNAAGDERLNKNGQIEVSRNKNKLEGFEILTFINKLFPNEKPSLKGQSHSFKEGAFVYSRQWESARIMKELFPGVEVRTDVTVMKGGTFQPTVDVEVRKKAKELYDLLIKILRFMRDLKLRGYGPTDIIDKSRHLWQDRAKWIKNKKVSPLYKASIDGSEPTFLISPYQILELLPLIQKGDFKKVSSGKLKINRRLKNVLDRLTISTARLKMNDHLRDIYVRTLDQCLRDPEYQSALAQKNCELILKRSKADMEMLAMQAQAENRSILVQKEISNIVHGAWGERTSNYLENIPRRGEPKKPAQEIPWPGNF